MNSTKSQKRNRATSGEIVLSPNVSNDDFQEENYNFRVAKKGKVETVAEKQKRGGRSKISHSATEIKHEEVIDVCEEEVESKASALSLGDISDEIVKCDDEETEFLELEKSVCSESEKLCPSCKHIVPVPLFGDHFSQCLKRFSHTNDKCKEYSRELNNIPPCPICLKAFSSHSQQLQHRKTCAYKYGLSTKHLLLASRLQEKQRDERLLLGLPLSPASGNSFTETAKVIAKAVKGKKGKDPDLELAVAMSCSVAEEEKARREKEEEALLDLGCPDIIQEERRKKHLVLPQPLSAPGQKEETTRRRRNLQTTLVMRTQEERQKIISERLAAILASESSKGTSSQRIKHVVDVKGPLKQYHNEESVLWNFSHSDILSPIEDHYVNDLENFIKVQSLPVGPLLKHFSQVPGRLNCTIISEDSEDDDKRTTENEVTVVDQYCTQLALVEMVDSQEFSIGSSFSNDDEISDTSKRKESQSDKVDTHFNMTISIMGNDPKSDHDESVSENDAQNDFTLARNDKNDVALQGNDKDDVALQGNDNNDVALQGNDKNVVALQRNDKDDVALQGNDNNDVALQGNDNNDVALQGNDKNVVALQRNDKDDVALQGNSIISFREMKNRIDDPGERAGTLSSGLQAKFTYDWGCVLASGDFSDIIIRTSNGEIPCHSLVLKVRCPHLLPAAPHLPEYLEWTSLSYESAYEFLAYLYTGSLSIQSRHSSQWKEMLEFAIQYNCKELVSYLGSSHSLDGSATDTKSRNSAHDQVRSKQNSNFDGDIHSFESKDNIHISDETEAAVILPKAIGMEVDLANVSTTRLSDSPPKSDVEWDDVLSLKRCYKLKEITYSHEISPDIFDDSPIYRSAPSFSPTKSVVSSRLAVYTGDSIRMPCNPSSVSGPRELFPAKNLSTDLRTSEDIDTTIVDLTLSSDDTLDDALDMSIRTSENPAESVDPKLPEKVVEDKGNDEITFASDKVNGNSAAPRQLLSAPTERTSFISDVWEGFAEGGMAFEGDLTTPEKSKDSASTLRNKSVESVEKYDGSFSYIGDKTLLHAVSDAEKELPRDTESVIQLETPPGKAINGPRNTESHSGKVRLYKSKSCTYGNLSSSKAMSEMANSSKSKTPINFAKWKVNDITPLPDYKNMVSPELKKALDRYGIRKLSRRKAITLLSHIYDQLHPFVSDSDVESTPSEAASTLPAGRAAPDKENLMQIRRKKVLAKPFEGGLCRSGKSFYSQRPSNDLNSSLDSLSLEGSDVECLEETQFGDSSDEDDLDSEKDGNFETRVKNFMMKNPALHEQILLYEPIWANQLLASLKQNGIKCGMKRLIQFLDQQCITFRLPAARTRRKRKKSVSCNKKQTNPKRSPSKLNSQ